MQGDNREDKEFVGGNRGKHAFYRPFIPTQPPPLGADYPIITAPFFSLFCSILSLLALQCVIL